MTALAEKLCRDRKLTEAEFIRLLEERNAETAAFLADFAVSERKKVYGNDVYVRGLIEFSNYCKNDCLYCGIRRSNKNAERYRLTKDDILARCREGYTLGFRTFVLQSGEDPHYTPEKLAEIVASIKAEFHDCAVTLSVGEHKREVYALWKAAGADRYLLRHETADSEHYSQLHPSELTLENRLRCLYDLKSLGYQVGCGIMVGSPYQTLQNIAKDLVFMKEFEPDMVGIGPFIPHHDTPFADRKRGSLYLTLYLLSIVRIMLPNVLLPATTALGSIHPEGRELGILSGANVCMPNLSPADVKSKYNLYDGKLSSGSESAECLAELTERMNKIGYRIALVRGDVKKQII